MDAIVWRVDVGRNIVSVFREEENVMKAAIAGVAWTRSDWGGRKERGSRKKQRPNWDLLNKKKRYLLKCVFKSKNKCYVKNAFDELTIERWIKEK